MPVSASPRVAQSKTSRAWGVPSALAPVFTIGIGLLPVSVGLGQVTPTPADYVIHELPTLGGDGGSVVEVNNDGTAVGWSELRPGDDAAHATLWSGGAPVDLGALGGDDSFAWDINDAGIVVGNAETASGDQHAVIWRNGGVTDLGTLGGENSTAAAINQAGAVVGRAQTASGAAHAFLWLDGVMTDLGTLGGADSAAWDIAASGVFYGAADADSGPSQAARWDEVGVTGLGTLGGDTAQAMAANATGTVVGFALQPDGAERAGIWRDGSLQELDPDEPSASVAVAINDSGDISGSIAPSTPEMRAVVWRGGERVTLPGFVDDMSGSFSITNAGVVGGYAADASGRHRPVLWVPANAPTPAALAPRSGVSAPAATPVGVPPASPTPASRSFVWDQVDVTVELREDSSFHVTEHLRVDFSGGPFRSGYRDIPLARIERFDNIRVGEVDGASVNPYRFVAPEAFSSNTPNTFTWREDGQILRIDWSFSPTTSAPRAFQLEYDAFGALGVYADAQPPYQQISWIGVDDALTETAPVNEASLTFVLPRAIDPDEAMLNGPGGNDPGAHTDDGQTWVWRATDLGPGESLTASLRFPPLVRAEAPSWQEARDRAEAARTGDEVVITPIPLATPVPQATPVADPVDAPPCREVMANDFPGQRREIHADCTTDRPIFVPEAWVFDGGGHTIYARDPDGGRLSGGVITATGTGSTVQNVTVDGSRLTTPCLEDDEEMFLAGVYFRGVSGHVSGVTVRHMQRDLAAGIDVSSPFVRMRMSCGIGIVIFGGDEPVEIADNVIEDIGYAGVVVESGQASISRNTIERAGTFGIHVYEAQVRITPGNRITDGRTGIQIEGANAGGRIAGNTVEQMSEGGIEIIAARATVDGNHVVGTGASGIGLLGATAAVRDNVMEDAFRGIYAGGDVVEITGNTVLHPANTGILVTEIGTDATIENNTIEASAQDGIWVQEGAQATLLGNTVTGAARYGIAAIQEDTHVTIDGNIVTDAGLHGIWIGNASAPVVRGNVVTDAAEDGILATDGADANIMENHVTGGQRGIDAAGAGTTVTVTGNTVERIGVAAITINGGATAPDVSGNTVVGAQFGIVSLGAGTTATVVNNTVSDLSGAGFTVESGAAADIRGNDISQAPGGIVVTSAGTTADLVENRIEGTTTLGIIVKDGARANVAGNTLLQPGMNGIEIDEAGHVTLEGNTIEDARGAGIRFQRVRTGSDGDVAFTLESHDIYYEPYRLTIPADTDVTVMLPNEGVTRHNVTIGALGIDVDIAPGATEEIVINAPAGLYEVFCNIPGHKEAGQTAALIVTATPPDNAGDEPGAAGTIHDNEISGGENGIVVTDSGTIVSVTENTISAPSATGITIENGATATLQDNAVSDAYTGINIVGAGTSATLTGNHVTDTEANGIDVQAGAEVVLRENTVMRAGESGIVVGGRNTTATLAGNIVSDAVDNGIAVESAATATVADGNSVRGGQWGIAILNDATTAEVRGNRVRDASNQGISVLYGACATIADNTVSGGESGIYVRYPRSRAVITGNTVSAERRGIYVWEEATAERIADNDVTDSFSGIVVEGQGARAVVEENSVSSFAREGIAVLNGATADVTGNRVQRNRRAPYASGIIVAGPGAAASIANNEVSNIGDFGIHISQGATGTVHCNTASEVSDTGIRVLDAGVGVVVSGNTLREAGTIGIEARVSEIEIRDNTIEGSTFAGIRLGAGAEAETTGNTIVGPAEPDADEPGPFGVHIQRDASGFVTGNHISGIVNTGAACAIHIDAAAPDIRVADNVFPAPGNDQDVCDERGSTVAATPTPAATPVAAEPCIAPVGLGPNVAVVTTRTTLLQKAPDDPSEPRHILAADTRLLVAPAISALAQNAAGHGCEWIPVIVTETGQPGFVRAAHVRLASLEGETAARSAPRLAHDVAGHDLASVLSR